jgi:hypothetical protein
VNEVTAADDDVSGYVRTLEERFDAETGDDSSDTSWGAHLPTSDELANEVERFLRDQREG